MKTLKIILLTSVFLLTLSFSLHHGWVNYNQEEVLEFTSEIQDPTYENPHSTMKVEYEDEEWLVILAPASRMESRGLTAEILEEGIPVKVVAYPHKSGKEEMRAERVFIDEEKYELR